MDYLCEYGYYPDWDLDLNGVFDEDDIIYYIENYIWWDSDGSVADGDHEGEGTYRGDFNLDGTVNGTDLSIQAGNFGYSPRGYADGNANCDWLVNGTDLSILAANFGNVATTAVPEPLTIGLLSVCGLVLLKRRENES